MSQSLLDIKTFAASVKAKYPDYAEADDTDLTSRIIQKYPEYRETLTPEALNSLQRPSAPAADDPVSRVHAVAQARNIPADIADDYLKLTKGAESGNRQFGSSGGVLTGPSTHGGSHALGMGQVMPDQTGGHVRTIGGEKFDLRDPEQNVAAGLSYFHEGGPDPIARRLYYFGGPRARDHYLKTGRIPEGGDGYTSFQDYIKKSGGLPSESNREPQRPTTNRPIAGPPAAHATGETASGVTATDHPLPPPTEADITPEMRTPEYWAKIVIGMKEQQIDRAYNAYVKDKTRPRTASGDPLAVIRQQADERAAKKRVAPPTARSSSPISPTQLRAEDFDWHLGVPPSRVESWLSSFPKARQAEIYRAVQSAVDKDEQKKESGVTLTRDPRYQSEMRQRLRIRGIPDAPQGGQFTESFPKTTRSGEEFGFSGDRKGQAWASFQRNALIDQEMQRSGPGLAPLAKRLKDRGVDPTTVIKETEPEVKMSDAEQYAALSNLGIPHAQIKALGVKADRGPTLSEMGVGVEPITTQPAFTAALFDTGRSVARAPLAGVEKGSARLAEFYAGIANLMSKADPGTFWKDAHDGWLQWEGEKLGDIAREQQSQRFQDLAAGNPAPDDADLTLEALGEAGPTILKYAAIAALFKGAGVSLSQPALFGLVSSVENGDKSAKDQLTALAKNVGMGYALKWTGGLGRVPAAATFAGISGAEAAIEGSPVIPALASGAVIGGALADTEGLRASEIPGVTLRAAIRNPVLPEGARDFLARLGDYDVGLVRSSDGRAVSLYRDKVSGEWFGNEIPKEQADKYDPAEHAGKTGGKLRFNAAELKAEEYDQLLAVLNIQRYADRPVPPKGLPGQVQPPAEPTVEKDVTPVKPTEPLAAEPPVIRTEPPAPIEQAPGPAPQGKAPIETVAPPAAADAMPAATAKRVTFKQRGKDLEGEVVREYASPQGVETLEVQIEGRDKPITIRKSLTNSVGVSPAPVTAGKTDEEAPMGYDSIGEEIGRKGTLTEAQAMSVYLDSSEALVWKVKGGTGHFELSPTDPRREWIAPAAKATAEPLPAVKPPVAEKPPVTGPASEDVLRSSQNPSGSDTNQYANAVLRVPEWRSRTLKELGQGARALTNYDSNAYFETANGDVVRISDGYGKENPTFGTTATGKLMMERVPREQLPEWITEQLETSPEREVLRPSVPHPPKETKAPEGPVTKPQVSPRPVSPPTDISAEPSRRGLQIKRPTAEPAEAKPATDISNAPRPRIAQTSQEYVSARLKNLPSGSDPFIATRSAKNEHQYAIKKAAKKGRFQVMVQSGEMTAERAVEIVKSIGQNVPTYVKRELAALQGEAFKVASQSPGYRVGVPRSNPTVNSASDEVRALGGIKDDKDGENAGEIQFLKESGRRGLINQSGGMNAERMAGALAEQGYFMPGVEQTADGFTVTNVKEFLNSLADDAAGTTKYHSTQYNPVVEDHPDTQAFDALTLDERGRELLDMIESGHARAADIAELARHADRVGLSDEALNDFLESVSAETKDSLSKESGSADGYTLDENGTLLDPDGHPLFSRIAEQDSFGFADTEGLLAEGGPQPLTETKADREKQKQLERLRVENERYQLERNRERFGDDTAKRLTTLAETGDKPGRIAKSVLADRRMATERPESREYLDSLLKALETVRAAKDAKLTLEEYLNQGSLFAEPLSDAQKQLARAVDSGKLVASAPALKMAVPTDSEAFEKWFAGSKVVDKNGEPKVVYHATRSDFEEFRPNSHFGTRGQAESQRERMVAMEVLSGKSAKVRQNRGQIIPVYLSIKSPMRTEDVGLDELWSPLIAEAKEQGYDGIVYSNTEEIDRDFYEEYQDDIESAPTFPDSWIAFYPEQIKSAIGNRGSFDPADPNILRSTRSEASKRLDELRRVDDDVDLIRDLKSSREDDIVWINPEGQELLRRMESDTAAGFFGMQLDKVSAEPILRDLKAGSAALRSADLSTKEIDGLHDHIRQALVAGRGHALIVMEGEASATAIKHETFHVGSAKGAKEAPLAERHSDANQDRLNSMPAAGKWRKHFQRTPEYVNASKALANEETAAMIAAGDFARAGITEDEAAQFLLEWAKSFYEKNGPKAFDGFERQEEHVTKAIDEAKRASRQAEAQSALASGKTVRRSKKPPTESSGGEVSPVRKAPGLGERIELRGQGEVREASLPKTLTSAGLDSEALYYQGFTDLQGREDAWGLYERHGLEGSLRLLKDTANPGKEHSTLSWMIQRIMLDKAAIAKAQGREDEAQRLEQERRELAAAHATHAVRTGQFNQAAASIGTTVETALYAADHIVREEFGANARLEPKVAAQIEEHARQAEAAFGDIAGVTAEIGDLRRRVAQLEKELSGKTKPTATRSAKRSVRQQLEAEESGLINLVIKAFALPPDAALKMAAPTELSAETREALAKLGALELMRNPDGTIDEWDDALIEKVGDGVEPYLTEVYADAFALRRQMVKEARNAAAVNRILKDNPEATADDIEAALSARELAKARARIVRAQQTATAGAERPDIRFPAVADAIGELASSDVVAETAGKILINKTTSYSDLLDAGLAPAAAKDVLREAQQVVADAKKQVEHDQLARRVEAETGKKAMESEIERLETQRLLAKKRGAEARAALARDLQNITRGSLAKLGGFVVDVSNSSRSSLAAGDFSFLLRQGGFLNFAYPEQQGPAIQRAIQAFTEIGELRAKEALENNPRFGQALRAGIDFASLGREEGSLVKGEEVFRGDLAKKIPVWGEVVKFSDRTYAIFLDTQRLITFSHLAADLESMGYTFRDNPKAFRDIARLVNVATGRGHLLGVKSNQLARIIMDMPYFSGRNLISRFQLLNLTLNPVAYARLSPGARYIVARSALRAYGSLAIFAALAALLGFEFVLDWWDDDFGKIKWGKTRYDLSFGLVPVARHVIRLGDIAVTGNRYPRERMEQVVDEVKRFHRTKVAPGPSLAWDAIAGEDFRGREFKWFSTPRADKSTAENIRRLMFEGAIAERVWFLPVQDIQQAWHEDGFGAAVKTFPASMLGVGVNTYPDSPMEPHTRAERLAAKLARPGSFHTEEPETEDKGEVRDQLTALRARAMKGEDVKTELQQMIDTGTISVKQAAAVTNATGFSKLQYWTKKLPLGLATLVAEEGSPDEERSLIPLLKGKIERAKEGTLTESLARRLSKLDESLRVAVEKRLAGEEKRVREAEKSWEKKKPDSSPFEIERPQ